MRIGLIINGTTSFLVMIYEFLFSLVIMDLRLENVIQEL